MMLSSLTSDEIRNAILAEDINKIKSIKGIGLKSAQRLILELKDKVSSGTGADKTTLFVPASNPSVDEATTALVMLGFTKANVTKAVSAVLKEKPTAKVFHVEHFFLFTSFSIYRNRPAIRIYLQEILLIFWMPAR